MRLSIALLVVVCGAALAKKVPEKQSASYSKKTGVDAEQRGSKLNLDFDGTYSQKNQAQGNWNNKGDKKANYEKGSKKGDFDTKAHDAEAHRKNKENYDAERNGKSVDIKTEGKTKISNAEASNGKKIKTGEVKKEQQDAGSKGILGGFFGGRGKKVDGFKAETETGKGKKHDATYAKDNNAEAGKYKAEGAGSDKIDIKKNNGILPEYTINKNKDKGGKITSIKHPKVIHAGAEMVNPKAADKHTKVEYLKVPIYESSTDTKKKTATLHSWSNKKDLAVFEYQGQDERPCSDVRGNKWTDKDFKIEKPVKAVVPAEDGPKGKTYKWPSCTEITVPMKIPSGTLIKNLAAKFTIYAPHAGHYICDSKYKCGSHDCFYVDLCGSELVSSNDVKQSSSTDYVFKDSKSDACDQPVSDGRNILKVKVNYCPPAESDGMKKGETVRIDDGYNKRTSNIKFRVDMFEKKQPDAQVKSACSSRSDPPATVIEPVGCREATVSYTGKAFFVGTKTFDDKAKGSGTVNSVSSTNTRTSTNTKAGGTSTSTSTSTNSRSRGRVRGNSNNNRSRTRGGNPFRTGG